MKTKIFNIVENKIKDLFDGIKGALLGPQFSDKHHDHSHDLSLPGVYEKGARAEGGIPNLETLKNISNISANYLDALKLKTINLTVQKLQEHLSINEEPSAVSISEAITQVLDKVTPQLNTIIDTEVQAAKNNGILTGIIRSSSAMGVEDPHVVFITNKSSNVCEDCVRLHLMPDKITPKIWKLSELNMGYFQKGDQVPSLLGCHPNCRCILSHVLPGFGFKDGKITYISKGHSEFDKQRD